MKRYEQHPLSSAFPGMSPEQLRELIDDIDLNGVREPIVAYENKILDGWHRYQACQELNVVRPPMVAYEGDDPVGYVLSKNLHRRHLDAGARAIIIARLMHWQEGAGKPSRSLVKYGNFATLDQAATLAGVSKKTMQAAKKASKATEEVQQAVVSGQISVHDAAKIAEKPEEEQREALVKPEQKKGLPKVRASDTVPLAVFQGLQQKHEELEERYSELAAELDIAQRELAAVESFRKNEQVKEIMKVHAQLRSMTEARDQWQNKCNEMTKQLNMLTKKK
jgi:hypothetical protein